MQQKIFELTTVKPNEASTVLATMNGCEGARHAILCVKVTEIAKGQALRLKVVIKDFFGASFDYFQLPAEQCTGTTVYVFGSGLLQGVGDCGTIFAGRINLPVPGSFEVVATYDDVTGDAPITYSVSLEAA